MPKADTMLSAHSSLHQHSGSGVKHQSSTSEPRYEARWNDFGKDMMRNGTSFAENSIILLKHLGSDFKCTKYLEWVEAHIMKKPVDYVLQSQGLVIHLEGANWIEGGSSLQHLNSLLSQSITSTKYPSEDLKRRFKGFQVGLQIYGRPTGRLQADEEACAKK